MSVTTTLLIVALLVAIGVIAVQRGTIRSQRDSLRAHGICGSVPPYPFPKRPPGLVETRQAAQPLGTFSPPGDFPATQPSHLRDRGIDRDISPETDSAIRALHQIERRERKPRNMCTSDNIALDGEDVFGASVQRYAQGVEQRLGLRKPSAFPRKATHTGASATNTQNSTNSEIGAQPKHNAVRS